jgi:hypothetical protein
MKKVSRKEVLRKPWNGATLPKCEFLKIKSVCKRSFAGGKWRKENVFENFSA